jgi:hypothetical protein
MFETIKIILCRALDIFFSEKRMNACINMLFYINIEYSNLEIQIILYRYIVFTFA